MRVTKAATSDKRVARMLDNAIQHFTRNIHFLHPDFPQIEKQPLTPENYENTRHFGQKVQNASNKRNFNHNNFLFEIYTLSNAFYMKTNLVPE